MFAASLAAILLLSAAAWALGFRSTPVLTAEVASAEAEGCIAGFRALEVALAADGRGALVRGADGSLALLLPLGDGWITRRVPAGRAIEFDGEVATVRLGEPLLKAARLRMAPVPDWLEAARG